MTGTPWVMLEGSVLRNHRMEFWSRALQDGILPAALRVFSSCCWNGDRIILVGDLLVISWRLVGVISWRPVRLF